MNEHLRQDEQYVISALAEEFCGTWRAGENPPDAYLVIGPQTIAVEISTLAQQVWGDGKGPRSRHSDDVPAGRLADELNSELASIIPCGWIVILTLRSPISQVRKVKALLAEKIVALTINPGDIALDEKILGNSIGIHVVRDESRTYKKVVAAIPNRYSNPYILLNAQIILEDRVRTKAEKCRYVARPLWLALFNDYFLADEETYRVAFGRMAISHPFERIVIIERNRAVVIL